MKIFFYSSFLVVIYWIKSLQVWLRLVALSKHIGRDGRNKKIFDKKTDFRQSINQEQKQKHPFTKTNWTSWNFLTGDKQVENRRWISLLISLKKQLKIHRSPMVHGFYFKIKALFIQKKIFKFCDILWFNGTKRIDISKPRYLKGK